MVEMDAAEAMASAMTAAYGSLSSYSAVAEIPSAEIMAAVAAAAILAANPYMRRLGFAGALFSFTVFLRLCNFFFNCGPATPKIFFQQTQFLCNFRAFCLFFHRIPATLSFFLQKAQKKGYSDKKSLIYPRNSNYY